MTELLEVRDLVVNYHSERGIVRALDGVSLAIGKGEVVGLVGESGCGKSTLARAILGVLPAPASEVRAGALRFGSENLLGLASAEIARRIRGRRITFIPQDPYVSLHPLFTIGQQMLDLMQWKSPLAQPARRGGWPAVLSAYPSARRARDRTAILDMLEAVQIANPEQALAKRPHELSGGQRQRIVIAMALLPQPELIIADEPTTALDVTIQAQILRLLHREVKRRQVSVLFTTHDLGTAWEICDRIVVMYAGQDVEAAPTAAFFAAPRHPYTARLLHSLPRADGVAEDIPGEIPSLIAPPPGCRFNPRCSLASAECRLTRPPVTGGAHRVRCHHPLDAPEGVAA
ncbi:MAG TPA: ABC transporter ATP-binding protein [Reyranella sp.]|nr:ABC transporter ATP-binding protein [Reyranella sp.]